MHLCFQFDMIFRENSLSFYTQEEAARKKKAAAAPVVAPKVYRSGVGKYIPQKPASRYLSGKRCNRDE